MPCSKLDGKVFIVTGAASGMGLSTAQVLLERGASLGICDINQKMLQQYLDSLSEGEQKRVLAAGVSVTDEAAITNFLNNTKYRFGKVDGLANYAGTGGHKLGSQLITDTDEKEFDFIMDLK